MEPGRPEASSSRRRCGPARPTRKSNRKAAQERKNAKSKVRIYDTFPIRNFDHWIDESKSPPLGRRRRRRSQAREPLLAASKAGGAAGLRRRGARRGVGAGRAVGRLCRRRERRRSRPRADCASRICGRWPPAGGEPKRLTPDGWDFGAPAFRPDGKALCFSAASAKPVIYQLPRLGCAAWPWSSPAPLSIVTKELRPLGRQLGVRARQPDHLLHRRRRRPRAHLRRAGGRRRREARRRRAAGRVHQLQIRGASVAAGALRELGERGAAAGDRPRRSGRPASARS